MFGECLKRCGWLWSVCVLACLAAVAGCGRAAGPPTPTPQPMTVQFTASATYEDAYSGLIDEFNAAHPGVTVVWSQVGGPGASSQLTCATCDVVRVNSQELTEEQLARYLPLDDLIAATKGFPGDDMAPGAMEALRYGGKQVAIPAGLNPIVAYYNPRLFEAAGIDVPAPTWTLDDLAQTAQALGEAGSQGGTYGFCSVPQSADPAILTYLFGGQLVDNLTDPTRPTLNTQANRTAVQWYADLRRIYQATPDPDEIDRLYGGNINRAIYGGRCGIWLGLYLDRAQYLRFSSGSDGLVPGVLPLPRGESPFGVISLDGYAILRTTEHAGAAWEWIQFLLDHAEAAGPILPPRASQYGQKTFEAQAGEEAAAVARNLPSTLFVWGAGLDDPALGGTVQAYLDAVDQVVRGGLAVDSALDEAQTRAEAAFAAR